MTDQKLKIDFATAGLIDLDGTRWITDRYVAIRCDAAALTTEDLDELPMPAPIDRAKYPYSASDPQTNGRPDRLSRASPTEQTERNQP